MRALGGSAQKLPVFSSPRPGRLLALLVRGGRCARASPNAKRQTCAALRPRRTPGAKRRSSTSCTNVLSTFLYGQFYSTFVAPAVACSSSTTFTTCSSPFSSWRSSTPRRPGNQQELLLPPSPPTLLHILLLAGSMCAGGQVLLDGRPGALVPRPRPPRPPPRPSLGGPGPEPPP